MNNSTIKRIAHLFNINDPDEFVRNILSTDHNIGKYFENINNVHIGGTNYKNITSFIYKNTTFNFHVIHTKLLAHYHLYSRDDIENPIDCAYIIIDKVNHFAVLHGMWFGASCFTKHNIDTLDTINGSTLLDMSIAFIKKIKKHYNLLYVQLKDNSNKRCNNVTLSLALTTTLLVGHTWYGKRKFLPRSGNGVSKIKELKYRNNYNVISKTYVRDVPNLLNYLKTSYDEIKPRNIKFSTIKKLYKKCHDDKLYVFLRAYLSKFELTCEMFELFYKDLATDLNIHNFSGESFILFL